MNRAAIFALLAVVAVLSSAAAVLFPNSKADNDMLLTEEQRVVREQFFGTQKELPPVKDGQEMRPRW